MDDNNRCSEEEGGEIEVEGRAEQLQVEVSTTQ